MALTVNTMLTDGGGRGSSLKEKRKAQIAANENIWDRNDGSAEARYVAALEENARRANSGAQRASAVKQQSTVPIASTPTADSNLVPIESTAPKTPPANLVPIISTTPAPAPGNLTEIESTTTPALVPIETVSWEAPTLVPIQDRSDYIRELYEMQKEANLKAIEDAYVKSMAEVDASAQKIPGYYYEAQRQQQGANARAQQANNEYFNARGLSTGTAGQAALAQRAVNLQNTAAINQAEADALADAEADRNAIMMDYQAQVRQAILNNETEKAAALYEEAMRVEQSINDTALKQAELDYKQYQTNRAEAEARAQMLASIGDFSGYKALGYTDAEVAAMQAYYDAANAPKYYGGIPTVTPIPNVTPTPLPTPNYGTGSYFNANSQVQANEAIWDRGTNATYVPTAPKITTEMQNVINQIDKGAGGTAETLLNYYTKSGRITPEQEEYIFNYAGI